MLLMVALVEMAIKDGERLWENFMKYWRYLVTLLALPFVSAFLFRTHIDTLWIIGTHEKHHGYLFLLGLVLFAFMILTRSRGEKKTLVGISLLSASIVACFTLLEYLHLYSFIAYQSASWEIGRTIATL